METIQVRGHTVASGGVVLSRLPRKRHGLFLGMASIDDILIVTLNRNGVHEIVSTGGEADGYRFYARLDATIVNTEPHHVVLGKLDGELYGRLASASEPIIHYVIGYPSTSVMVYDSRGSIVAALHDATVVQGPYNHPRRLTNSIVVENFAYRILDGAVPSVRVEGGAVILEPFGLELGELEYDTRFILAEPWIEKLIDYAKTLVELKEPNARVALAGNESGVYMRLTAQGTRLYLPLEELH